MISSLFSSWECTCLSIILKGRVLQTCGLVANKSRLLPFFDWNIWEASVGVVGFEVSQERLIDFNEGEISWDKTEREWGKKVVEEGDERERGSERGKGSEIVTEHMSS